MGYKNVMLKFVQTPDIILKKLNFTIALQRHFIELHLFFIFMAVACSSISFYTFGQQAGSDLESQIKAAYIFNFTKFLEWKHSDAKVFTIVVIGESKVSNHLNKIAGKEKVNGKPIVVNQLNDARSIDACNILYLPSGDKDLFYETLKKIKGKKILLVSNTKGFAEKGAGINFIQVADKIKFEINRKTLESEGIVPNSSLLSLAYKVYE